MKINPNIKLNISEVSSLLDSFDKEFSPALSTSINLHDYAIKLSENAFFLTVNAIREIPEAFAAYYINNDNKFAYITLIAVASSMRKKGVGRLMLDSIIKTLPEDFTHVGLEVLKSNASAVSFYQHYGFDMIEDRGEKWLLHHIL